MRIITISDTYGSIPEISESCDIFIHCGNFMPIFQKNVDKKEHYYWLNGKFKNWINSINAKHKVFIAGDSDFIMEDVGVNLEYHFGLTYLKNEAITIMRQVIYGMPYIPASLEGDIIDSDGMFLSPSEKHFLSACKRIPKETNILISRIPAYSILDNMEGNGSIGSQKLYDKIKTLKELRLHLFGMAFSDSLKSIKVNKCLHVNACMVKDKNQCIMIDY